MSKLGIQYTGPCFDASGYAQFARNFITGLVQNKEVDLTVKGISFETARPNLGTTGEVIASYCDRKIDYQINILNALPDMLPKFAEAGKKNICFTMFETSRIPDSWVRNLNTLSTACFVPCRWNREVFQRSGVTVPVYVVPPGINTSLYQDLSTVPDIELSGLSPDAVVFYSIFQWTERKNPIGLLKAYLSAFDGLEDVYLVLKTYGSDHTPAQQQRIKETINQVKGQLRLKKAPKILLVGSLLSNQDIMGLHKRGDCFVLPHRAEGFGMPHIEAMICEKPVITTGFSGNMDFMNPSNSYLLDYQMTVVSNMPWIPHYEADMEWAEPNLSQLKLIMKNVYNEVKESRTNNKDSIDCFRRAAKARKDILQYFNLEVTTEHLVNVCKEIVSL